MNVRQSKNTATDFTTVRDSNVASAPPRCARGCTSSAITRDAIPLSSKRSGHDRGDCALHSHHQRVDRGPANDIVRSGVRPPNPSL